MKEKHNDATRNRPAGERVIDAQSMCIDIPAYAKQIRQEDAWRNADRNAITIFKTADMRIVLGGLHKDAELPAHKADGVMNIQVIEGLLQVNTDECSTDLGNGQMMVIHKGYNYRAIAIEETIYLLTITDVGE